VRGAKNTLAVQRNPQRHSEPAKALQTPQALQGLLYLLPVTGVCSENTPRAGSIAQSKVSENFASEKRSLARFVQHSMAETPSNEAGLKQLLGRGCPRTLRTLRIL
jgi:hypothetical protein